MVTTDMIKTSQGTHVSEADMKRLRDRLERIRQLKCVCMALRQLARDVKNATEDASTEAAQILRERLEQLER